MNRAEERDALVHTMLMGRFNINATLRHGKNSAFSVEARHQGNSLYASSFHDKKVHLEILSSYTQSAALAKCGSEELAMAFGNRSALLMHLGKLEECLSDIERALDITASSKLRSKLEDRRARCKSLQADGIKTTANRTERDLVRETGMRPSKSIPCASEAVSLQFDEKYGRHIVALRDIEPGTVVAVEKGILFYPKPHKKYLHCSHCLSFAWNGIPCDYCTVTVYCSESCKEEAWLQYHDVECKLLPYLITAHDDIERWVNLIMTVRIFVKLVREEGLEKIVKQAKDIDNCKDLCFNQLFDDGCFQGCTFKTIYSLSTKRIAEEPKLVLSMIFRSLIEKDFIFQNVFPKNDYLNESIIKILVKLHFIININAFSYEYVKKNGYLYSGQNRMSKYKIGGIVTSFCSFFNHSCNYNTNRVFINGHIVAFTIDYIKKGQQLFLTYAPDLSTNAIERKDYLLKTYDFECDCYPCREDWSLQIYDKEENHSAIVMDLLPKIVETGAIETFRILLDTSQICPLTESCYDDVKKIIKAVNKHCNTFHAVVNNVLAKHYIERYVANAYGMKLDMINDRCET